MYCFAALVLLFAPSNFSSNTHTNATPDLGKIPPIEPDVDCSCWYGVRRVLDPGGLSAGGEVKRGDAADAGARVVELDSEALAGPRQVKVHDMTVALSQDAVGCMPL